MNSLRGRIVALSALVALATTGACTLVASRSILANLEDQEQHRGAAALATIHQQLVQVLTALAFEVNDYANWDELYVQMPKPDAGWAAINLTPGKVKGALTTALVTAVDNHITGRFRNGEVRLTDPSITDPAPGSSLIGLIGDHLPRSGLALLAGHPALYATSPILPSSRTGPAHGVLVALAYVDQTLLDRLTTDGWKLTYVALPDQGSGIADGLRDLSSTSLVRGHNDLTATATLMTHDGGLRFVLTRDRSDDRLRAEHTILAICWTGLGAALGAMLIGVWLGWRWLQPITALADACQQQDVSLTHALPTIHGLREADLLRRSIASMVARLQIGQNDLAAALDRETTANAVHRRFLAQLAHEFGHPILALITAIERLERQGGQLAPEDAAQVRQNALALEERFQEVLGLVQDLPSNLMSAPRLELQSYLHGIASLLRPQMERRGVQVITETDDAILPLDARLLTPILINLAANALHASTGGAIRITASVDREHQESVWLISDQGQGIADDLARRITAACQRGEVLPGEPGFGLGLALALANARALGGRLRLIDSTPQGTTFEVRLPIDDGAGGRRSDGSTRFTRAPTKR